MLVVTSITLSVSITLTFLYFHYQKVTSKYSVTQSTVQPKNAIEYQEPIELSVDQGKIPEWLHGIMYRIGPGKFHIRQKDGAEFTIRHAFDGLPFVHRFEINGATQTVKYNSRMTAKSVEEAIKNKSYAGLIFFGHILRVGFFEWLHLLFARVNKMVLNKNKVRTPLADGSSVGVTTTPNYHLPKHLQSKSKPVLVSKTDANVLQKVNATTLEPEAIFNYGTYDSRLEGQFSAAHHQWDPTTNENFNFTLSMAPKPRLIVFSTNANGDVTVLGDITHRLDKTPITPAYIHSFWLTQNYVIIPEFPLAYTDKGIRFLTTGAVLSSMFWKENQPAYFHVFRRDGQGLVASIPTPGFYTFHSANAFEKDNVLYLDCASFEEGSIIHKVKDFGTLRSEKQTHLLKPEGKTQNVNGIEHPILPQTSFGDLVRYQLNLDTLQAKVELIIPNVEFPRFNHKKTLVDYRYIFGCQMVPFSQTTNDTVNLVKVDTKLEGYPTKNFEIKDHMCSEPIFVAKPNGTSEDDGVLLTLVSSVDSCFLSIIDAIDMKELARIQIGKFSPLTFHGSYVDYEFKTISPN